MEMTSEPWMTTPEFSTWSSTSSSEISLSGPPVATSSSGSAGMRAHERVGRPRAGGFDAPLVSPAARKFGEDVIPFLAVTAAQQETRLPFESTLPATDLAARDGIGSDLRQRLREALYFFRKLRRAR